MRNWRDWVDEGYFKTENLRAGGLVWPRGASGLHGDPLGPLMHAHDGASEVFLFLEGSCRFEVGNLSYDVGPGDFVYVPPEVPHNLINAGDSDMWVFFTVGPNVVDSKWRTDGFAMDGWAGRVRIARAQPDTALPGDERVAARVFELAGDVAVRDRQRDLVYLVMRGEVEVQVGDLAGEIGERDYIVVPSGIACALRADGAQLLEISTPGRE